MPRTSVHEKLCEYEVIMGKCAIAELCAAGAAGGAVDNKYKLISRFALFPVTCKVFIRDSGIGWKVEHRGIAWFKKVTYMKEFIGSKWLTTNILPSEEMMFFIIQNGCY